MTNSQDHVRNPSTSMPILTTKLYTPPPRPKIVLRPRLLERLNEGLATDRKLTLISASAGFGKTTLVSEWAAVCERPVAWLSLDEGDNGAYPQKLDHELRWIYCTLFVEDS